MQQRTKKMWQDCCGLDDLKMLVKAEEQLGLQGGLV